MWVTIVPIVVTVVAFGVTMLTTLGGFATFRDYLSIREFAQYKELQVSEREGMRRRLDRLSGQVLEIEKIQKVRAGTLASIDELRRRTDALSVRLNEAERKFTSAYSVGDELKRLQDEIRSLRSQVTGPK